MCLLRAFSVDTCTFVSDISSLPKGNNKLPDTERLLIDRDQIQLMLVKQVPIECAVEWRP